MSILRSALPVLFLVACGPSAQVGADGAVTDDPCQPAETRCVGQSYQVCDNGFFVESEACAASKVCAPDLGCVDCRPNSPLTCVGDSVHQCNSDGTVGDFVEMCEFESCSNGNCGGDDCAAGADIIYTVDDKNNFYSFDPRLLPADAFSQIGVLNCPAGAPYPEFDPLGTTATPFSMSVDRNATAWVLYSSGDIFHVSTSDASCQATSFQKGQSGFELFGMGFVSNSPGSSEETLFISGGDAGSQTGGGNLGAINPGTMGVTSIAALPGGAEYSPELTGTGEAGLFGYYPGMSSSYVSQIDKTNATNTMTWNLPALQDQVRGWAFAHWGGEYYIFITTQDFLLNEYSRVLKLDPVSGNVTTALDNTGKVIVGAGVSTCAPVIVN